MRGDHIKLTFLGESAIGKTSIANRLVHNKFTENYDNTIGASYMILKLNDLIFDIWDTAGQERYLSLVQFYYRDTDIFLLIFDVTQLYTIDRLKHYAEKILQEMKTDFKVVIIGNKIDLINDIEMEKIDKLIKNKMSILESSNITVKYLYVSTKTGKNFSEISNVLKIYGNQLKEMKCKNFSNIINKNNGSEKIINLDQSKGTSYFYYC